MSFSYYYTVEIWENFDIASRFHGATDDATKALDDAITNRIVFSGDAWMQEQAETLVSSKKKTTIQKGTELLYFVRVYMKNNANNHHYWLPNLGGDLVTLSIDSTWNGYNKFTRGKVQTKAEHTDFGKYIIASAVTSPDRVNPHNLGVAFIFTLKAKETGDFDAVKLKIDITNDSTCCPTGSSGTDVDPNASTQHPTLKGPNPTLKVSTAPKAPKIPQSLKTASANSPYTIYNSCDKLWYSLRLDDSQTSATSSAKPGFFMTLYTTKADGTGLSTPIKRKFIPAGKDQNVWPSEIMAQMKKLKNIAAGSGDCSGSTSGNGGTSSEDAPPAAVVAKPPTADLRWNPPPHTVSRSMSFGDLMSGEVNSFEGTYLTAAQINNLKYLNTANFERGRLFQDAASAKALNSSKDKELVPWDRGPKVWGFRFMYNPSTFNYSTSANNSIDWTMGAADVSVLLAGNQTINLSLYLNRIVDMTALQHSRIRGYPRELEEEEKDGILNRGTEYDIEFLYRVLNGDPTPNNLLFNPSYKGKSADFGYTTGVPCWLYLNDNFRVFGSVAGFSVNHVMFTDKMIPMFSTVDLTFTRYPAYSPLKASKDDKKGQGALDVTDYNNYVANEDNGSSQND